MPFAYDRMDAGARASTVGALGDARGSCRKRLFLVTATFFGQRFQLIPSLVNLLQLCIDLLQFIQGLGNDGLIFFVELRRTDLPV